MPIQAKIMNWKGCGSTPIGCGRFEVAWIRSRRCGSFKLCFERLLKTNRSMLQRSIFLLKYNVNDEKSNGYVNIKLIFTKRCQKKALICVIYLVLLKVHMWQGEQVWGGCFPLLSRGGHFIHITPIQPPLLISIKQRRGIGQIDNWRPISILFVTIEWINETNPKYTVNQKDTTNKKTSGYNIRMYWTNLEQLLMNFVSHSFTLLLASFGSKLVS